VTNILHSKIIGHGRPLLILHGFLGSGDNWITLGRQFSKSFEVHLIDLRNHGRSFHDDEMDLEIMSQDVLYYCKFYQLPVIFIIGHSMGGKVAMHLAVMHLNLVKKLIVVDIAPKAYGRRHDFIMKALQAVDFDKQKTRDEVAKVISQYIEKEAYRQFLLKAVYRKSKSTLSFRFNLAVFVENYGNIVETLPVYSQFEGDTLFIKGSLSDYILKEDYPLINAHFPKAIIKEIDKSGHWLHAEKPKEFYAICTDFLGS
jgi:pimeloyl-ACP methyl ester carboxylesterase